jgi:predicted negative regulator of RcsB-dependent stress response
LLLGDIYFAQNDLFNAKATYQSVVENASDSTLQKEAQDKLMRFENNKSGN